MALDKQTGIKEPSWSRIA